MDGQPTFWARENGTEIGARAPRSAERAVTLADTLVGPMKAPSAPQNARKDRK